jgi:elongation factor Ts
MADFSAKDVQKLRLEAGVGMMDAKTALADAGGDFDQAFQLLRERGQAKMAKRSDREANEGVVGSYIHIQSGRPVIGVLVELVCETDFVAKSEEFTETANDIAMHVSWSDPRWVTRDQVDEADLAAEKELIAKQAESEGKPADVIPRIVEGKIESFYVDNVLYEQKFVNAERFDGTVGDMIAALATRMGENISVRSIARLSVGS